MDTDKDPIFKKEKFLKEMKPIMDRPINGPLYTYLPYNRAVIHGNTNEFPKEIYLREISGTQKFSKE
jgi:hypothetical protein